jgi:hypothetical protein
MVSYAPRRDLQFLGPRVYMLGVLLVKGGRGSPEKREEMCLEAGFPHRQPTARAVIYKCGCVLCAV